MKNPVNQIDLVATAVGCFNRLVDAYETSKRIELEREQLECQHDLDKRKLAIMERDLERKHKQALKVLEMRNRELTTKLELLERNFGVYEKKMMELCEASRMAMNKICDGDEKDRAFYLQLWLKVNELGSHQMALECEILSKGMVEYNRQVACLIDSTGGLSASRQIPLAKEGD